MSGLFMKQFHPLPPKYHWGKTFTHMVHLGAALVERQGSSNEVENVRAVCRRLEHISYNLKLCHLRVC